MGFGSVSSGLVSGSALGHHGRGSAGNRARGSLRVLGNSLLRRDLRSGRLVASPEKND